ncbi:hypothetical protein FHY17_002357 [Xanthomonas arboricola]|uniref:Uncharacterized protein n=1 Tax=Xanthomonas arboricola TaxID=56448 RepID=A0AB73GSG2_9XANT|nr:hypothetical protein [Xanthomonas arboricola]MBB4768760.1 hypothetical protein [Xanthomonas arboricola]MBB5668999.1 hypothetical protein [Xanthomonas arboricola]
MSYRKRGWRIPFLCELMIGFSASGYVLLFEVASDQVVTVGDQALA